jgi:glycosyltransferase involved in cell wall biosynthesis
MSNWAEEKLIAEPKISVAMATYDGEAFLADQLQSIIDQTRRASEIVICDDCSRDNTLAIATEFAEKSPIPIRIFKNEVNLGYRANFQLATEKCRGEIIFFSDQDDVWLPSKVEAVVRTMEQTGALAVTHNFYISDVGQDEMYLYDKYIAESGLPPIYNILGCSLAFRRSLIDTFGWPRAPYSTAHDRWVIILATFMGKRSCTDETLMIRRIHGSNVSGVWGGGDKYWRRMLRAIKLVPFTSSLARDLVTAHWGSLDACEALIPVLREKSECLPAGTVATAIKSLQRASRIRAFTRSSAYERVDTRIMLALYLFLTLNYRNGDGVFGLTLDIFGKRKNHE